MARAADGAPRAAGTIAIMTKKRIRIPMLSAPPRASYAKLHRGFHDVRRDRGHGGRNSGRFLAVR